MKYSFISPIKSSGETKDGVLYSCGYTDEELEAKVDTLIDPTLDQEPKESDPESIYPEHLRYDKEKREDAERGLISLGIELPPLRLLPEDSLLRVEWFRRAEILKAERAAMRAEEERAKESGD